MLGSLVILNVWIKEWVVTCLIYLCGQETCPGCPLLTARDMHQLRPTLLPILSPPHLQPWKEKADKINKWMSTSYTVRHFFTNGFNSVTESLQYFYSEENRMKPHLRLSQKDGGPWVIWADGVVIGWTNDVKVLQLNRYTAEFCSALQTRCTQHHHIAGHQGDWLAASVVSLERW